MGAYGCHRMVVRLWIRTTAHSRARDNSHRIGPSPESIFPRNLRFPPNPVISKLTPVARLSVPQSDFRYRLEGMPEWHMPCAAPAVYTATFGHIHFAWSLQTTTACGTTTGPTEFSSRRRITTIWFRAVAAFRSWRSYWRLRYRCACSTRVALTLTPV